MRKNFTKKDLHTGDIIETRNGERGVVVLEKDCILYQTGGLDCMDVFTDDLFVDGPEREGDIFKVYHDPEGPLGINKLFDMEPVFVRKNDVAARERAAQLTKKYDLKKDLIWVMVFEPYYRRCEKIQIKLTRDFDLDMVLSEAPSMTACGKIKTDRTFVHIPNTTNLYLLYSKYQEEWHLRAMAENDDFGVRRKSEPMVVIPEENLRIHSRCMLVKMNECHVLEDLLDEDFSVVKKYLYQM